MKSRRIRQDFWIKGKLVIVEDVPVGVCLQCGEKVVKADVGRRITGLMENWKRLRNARTMRVPVIKFAKEIA